MDDEMFIYIVIGFPIAIALSTLMPLLLKDLVNINNYIMNNLFYIVGFALFTIYMIFSAYYIVKHSRIKNKIRKKDLEEKRKLIVETFKKKLDTMNSGEIENYKVKLGGIGMMILLDKRLSEFNEDLVKRNIDVEKSYIKVKSNEELNEIREEKEDLEVSISFLEEKKRKLEQTKEERKQRMRNELNIYENDVFKKGDLTKMQILILKESGFVQTNEYDIFEQKIITVFVKKISNHSLTHTFLVWSVMNYLDKIPGVEKILEHDTKDADITFVYQDKKYAIEVETGNLLRKKIQKQNKIKELNRKYPNKWMFLVSNRNLKPKYRKLGQTADRKEVKQKIKNLLR